MLPVTLVTVHWNQPERLAESLARFVDQGVDDVIVVDNASAPEHRKALDEVVRASSARVEVLDQATNLGFGPGMNAGLRHWLSTRDTAWAAVAPHDALPGDGCVAALVEAAAGHDRAGLASAEFGDGETPIVDPYFGGITIPSTVDIGWEDSGFPHGTLFLAGRACLADIGPFDPRYFAHGEEADLGLRAAKAGWGVGIVRGALVVNPSLSTSLALNEYLKFRNSFWLVRTHFGRYKVFIRLCMAGGDTLYRWLRPAARTEWFVGRARFDAMVDFVRGRSGPPPARYAR